MALDPKDERHARQISAGVAGRRIGHAFEDALASRINALRYPMEVHRGAGGHLATGDPAELLLRYVARSCGIVRIVHASATATGSLATSEVALAPVAIGGKSFTRSKSDLVLRIAGNDGNSRLVGISTKQCNNLSPTNAQLYFTTAQGFVNLLKAQGVVVSDHALRALRQFCGEPGYRPLDDLSIMAARGRIRVDFSGRRSTSLAERNGRNCSSRNRGASPRFFCGTLI